VKTSELEVIWPLHRRHYFSPPDPGIANMDAVEEPLSQPIVATPGRKPRCARTARRSRRGAAAQRLQPAAANEIMKAAAG